MRRLLLLCAVLALVAAPVAGSALAPEVAGALDLRGYYLEGTADGATVNTLERLAAGATAAGGPVYFVRLTKDPISGNDAFARAVQGQLPDAKRGTIYVQSPGEIGADSVTLDDAQLNAAFDDTEGAARQCFELGAQTFLRVIGGTSTVPVTCPAKAGRGGGGAWWLLALLALPVGFLGVGLLSRRRLLEWLVPARRAGSHRNAYVCNLLFRQRDPRVGRLPVSSAG